VPLSQLTVQGYWKVNARAALRHINLAGIDAEIAVWVRTDRNCSDICGVSPN
jgi:hypothetical protein